jgi:peptide/nickel transport system permease protein
MAKAPNVVAYPESALGKAGKRSLGHSWARTLRRFVRNKPLGAVGGLIVLLLILVGLFADWIAPMRYDDFDVRQRLLGVSWSHPFGTDEQGRDVFSRVIYGARTSVLIGFGAVGVGLFIATVIGVISGFYGGVFDILTQRLIDIWLSFPNLIFIIFVVAIFGRSTLTLVITLGLLISAGSSRIIRSVSIGVSQMQYVESARAGGAGDARIILRHVLPNVLPIIIISASVQIGAVILTESSLSFLGFGPPPPFPSWGRMLQEAQTTMTSHPNLAVFPGVAITIVVYSFNMFGDALRDVLDPRMRGSR